MDYSILIFHNPYFEYLVSLPATVRNIIHTGLGQALGQIKFNTLMNEANLTPEELWRL